MTTRTAERIEFLGDLLAAAIENYGYGWFAVAEYRAGVDDPASDVFAVIREGETGAEYRVTVDTMATGLGVIRNAKLATVDGEQVRVNAEGERLYFGGEARRELLFADRTNGVDGDYDVVGALAVLECALFGRVVYA